MRTAKLDVRLARCFRAAVLLLWACLTPLAWAGNTRFISGQGWGIPAGWGSIWQVSTLRYYTDLGPLSATATHAQADAMVAAAAAVWNVPTSSLSLVQGGELAEDVDSTNTFFDGTQFVFPPDVQIGNEDNIPVAIVYDRDGSLIDMLLGEGASDPEICRQNGVVGDVDDIHQTDGGIHHATLLLNGRCVGSDPAQLTQMQYQLARAFGRVLGLSWSQTNDNVFTAQTTVTAHQMAFWPLLHPIDVICGNYTYQCMTDPFTLRVDDLNTLAQAYPIFQSAVTPGKRDSIDDALWLWGLLWFPDTQGMDWVNLTARRNHNGIQEDWQTTSGITGYNFQQAAATPVNPTPAVNSGSTDPFLEGYFSFRRVPLDSLSDVFFTTEPINPLYTGDAAIGPYVRPPATPSGSPTGWVDWSAIPAGDRSIPTLIINPTAAAGCGPGQDGAETAPAAFDPAGWQTGMLCRRGHNSWWQVSITAGHTWTLEVTATDETGFATVNKAQPVMGVWAAADPAGTLPTVASQVAPFNSMVLGMTQLRMSGSDTDQAYRLSISDQFGAGRPDFPYTARVLYAAAVTPAVLGSGGGRLTVTGTGFRQGNQVLVNGVPARVLSWSATQILAIAPTLQRAGAQLGTALAVTVADASTGGVTTIPDAFSYAVTPNLLQQVSAPGALKTGIAATVPFAVRVLASDGVSPVVNDAVTFAVTAGSAQLSVCNGAVPCVALTDANGIVRTTVTGGAAGPVTLAATAPSAAATIQFTLLDTDPVRSVVIANPTHYVAAGASGTWTVALSALEDDAPAAGVGIGWSGDAALTQGAASGFTGDDGLAMHPVTATLIAADSVQTVTGCAWAGICAAWTLHGVDPSQWLVSVTAQGPASVPAANSLGALLLTVTDAGGHPLESAPVEVHQRVLAWETPCSGPGRCPAVPVLAASVQTVVSDSNGEVHLTPLQLDNTPQVVEIAVATGTQGFTTMTLVKAP